MTQPFKVCPKCQSPADLNAAQCLHCGRQYKTQFAAASPADQTQMFTTPAPSLPPQAFPVVAPAPNAKLIRALIVMGILCASAYLFNTAQVWYVEGRAIQAKREYDAQQEQARANAEKQIEETQRQSETFYRNLNRMDTGQPIPQENNAGGIPGVSAPMPPVRIINQPGDPSRVYMRNGESISREQYDQSRRTLQSNFQNNGAMGVPR